MAPVQFALMWHHHQPTYTDPHTGQPALPWVRLHAIKDYWGMARLVESVDGMRATVNLVPSLVEQIAAYAEGRAVDPHLVVARKRTDDLSEDESVFMLEHFFSANWDTMIRPVPRYCELLELRDAQKRSPRDAVKRFGARDLRDLSILYDLVWFHPLLREEDEVVRELWRKGANFSEDDRKSLHEREQAVIGEVIPLHKRLADAGRLEIATSPYYHAIIPLMLDFACIREALPSASLPERARSLADDASIQIAGALSYFESVFGARPRGMWPSEGAVSQQAVELLADQGVQWIVTDEQILERSLGCSVGRTVDGLARPEILYRPYTTAGEDAPARIVFRDHYLSDLIGFRYRTWRGESAAYDLLGRLRAIGESWREDFAPLVAIVLDGENAWEHYPNQGVEFLSTLYRGLASGGDGVRSVTMSEGVAASDADELGRVFAGSWIDHDFRIWGGHEEDRVAWDLVYGCRDALDAAGAEPDGDARAELRIAQGSDWFWWYGDDHSCANDAEFDRLFRAHVRKAYELAGLTAPSEVDRPIKRQHCGPSYTSPTDLVTATVDGEVTHYYEWLGAGRAEDADALGVMDLPRSRAIKMLAFGCDVARLYVRVDFRSRTHAGDVLGKLRLSFALPKEHVVMAQILPGSHPVVVDETSGRPGECALGRILEIGVPWVTVEARPGDRVRFVVERIEDGKPTERVPREGALELDVPKEDDVKWDWSAE